MISEKRRFTYPKFVSYLRIGFEFPIIWTTPMTSNETTMFVFNRVLMCDIRIDDAPEIGIIDESGRNRWRAGCLNNGG